MDAGTFLTADSSYFGSDGVTEADTLWRRFLDLALDSPWAEQAQIRLDRVQ